MKNLKIFLLLIMACFIVSLTGCSNNHTITYHIDEVNEVGEIKVAEDSVYTIKVKEIDYYNFVGYYDSTGAKYTDEVGKCLFPYDLTTDLELYAKYTPCKYTIKMDLSEADNKDEFDSSDKVITVDDEMPTLPLLEKAKHDLICYEATIGGETIVISEAENYLDGFENIENYVTKNKNSDLTISIKPVFDKKKHNMTFIYNKDGETVTENLKVYIETDINDAAPTYKTEDGTIHQYAWKTAEQKEQNHPYIFYSGQTAEGLVLYADYFQRLHQLENSEFTVVETYTISENKEENTLHLPSNSSTLNLNIDVNARTTSYTVKLHNGSTYQGLSFNLLDRESDVTIVLKSDSTTNFAKITSTEKHNIIEGNALTEEQLVSLIVYGNVELNGLHGINGANGKDESGGSAIGGSDNLPPAESGKAGTDGTGCIQATNVLIDVMENSTLNLFAGNGGHGGNGGIPRPTDQKETGWGADGGSGGLGGSGAHAVEAQHLILNVAGTMNVVGGNGGNGGAGGKGSYAVGGFFHDVDCAGDGGAGNDGGNGGYCFKVKSYEVIEYANGTLVAGSAGNGGAGGNGGDAGTSKLYGDGPGGLGGDGGDAGEQGDIGFKESIGDHLSYTGSYTKSGGARGNNGYNGDGTNDHLGSEITQPGIGKYGILFGKMWE